MKKYHIGLDFGTNQTKSCVYDIDNNVHEFYKFPATNSFFLPSKVGVKNDGTFEYGNSASNPTVQKEYHYFKIASAEDEQFHVETFEISNASKLLYDRQEFYPYTPEFLSVIYLTNVLFSVKNHYKLRLPKKQKGTGFFNKLFSTSSKAEDVSFTVQLGIPTEWSQIKNLKRKRKFENILMIAELLQKIFKTNEEFLKATSDEIIVQIKNIFKGETFSGRGQFDDELNKLGISVFPETAAGLTFIVKSRQLLPGYYGIMDIGAGTTDISFFSVEARNTIKYLASESYMIAANNVYKQLSNNNSIQSVHEAEKEVHRLLELDNWQKDEKLTGALIKVKKDLNKMVYKLFHRRIHHFKNSMVSRYADQPMLLYGGGSQLPGLDAGFVEIYDNGNPAAINCTVMEKQKIDRYTSLINVLPEDGSWKRDLSLLVVALGLSYIKPDSFTNWFGEENYHPTDGDVFRKRKEIPHPQNEDYYIYDILNSKWSR